MYLGLSTMLIGFVIFVIARWLTVKKQDLSKMHAVLLVDAATILFEGNVIGFFFALALKKLGFTSNVLSVTNSLVFILITILLQVVALALFFANEKMFKLTNFAEQDSIKYVYHFCGLTLISSLVWYFLYIFLL